MASFRSRMYFITKHLRSLRLIGSCKKRFSSLEAEWIRQLHVLNEAFVLNGSADFGLNAVDRRLESLTSTD